MNYIPGFGGEALGNRTADAWYYLCSTSGHYPNPHDSRNHPEVPWESPELEKARLGQPKNWDVLAPDHNPYAPQAHDNASSPTPASCPLHINCEGPFAWQHIPNILN